MSHDVGVGQEVGEDHILPAGVLVPLPFRRKHTRVCNSACMCAALDEPANLCMRLMHAVCEIPFAKLHRSCPV